METFFEILKLIFSFILLVLLFIFIFYSFIGLFVSAPFIPSSRKKTLAMIAAADLKESDNVYDLGSGDGRIVIEAAKKGVKNAVGFEINPLLNVFARINAKRLKVKNTSFITKSLWKADLANCDKLFIYLLPSSMRKIENKILTEMKPGSLVISNTFSFKNLNLVEEDDGIKIYEIVN